MWSLASIVYRFFDKKASATRTNKFSGTVKSEIMSNESLSDLATQTLAEELHNH